MLACILMLNVSFASEMHEWNAIESYSFDTFKTNFVCVNENKSFLKILNLIHF